MNLELKIRRTIRASRERVFEAWTTPALLVKWWGPQGISCPGAEVDLREGGTYRIGNLTPDGKEIWIQGVFEKIDPPQELIYTWSMDPEHPDRERVSVQFVDLGDATEIQIHHERLADEKSVKEHGEGWAGCLDGLERLLAGV